MIEIISAPDHVAAFRISGTVEAADYDKIIPDLEEALKDHKEIGVFVDMQDFEDMTGEAIRRDIKYGIDMIGEIRRFRRAAFITDKQWVKAVTDLVSSLFPQIEARVFPIDEKEAAMKWVSDFRSDPRPTP